MSKQKSNKCMDDKARSLVMENINYADKIANIYRSRGVQYDDLKQEARLALCEAALRFDPNKGAQLTTFSTLYIHGCLAKFVMRFGQHSYLDKIQRKFVKILSLDNKANDTLNIDRYVSDHTGEDTHQASIAERVEDIMQCLTTREQTLIRIRFLCDGDKEWLEMVLGENGIKMKRGAFFHQCNILLDKMAKYAKKNNL